MTTGSCASAGSTTTSRTGPVTTPLLRRSDSIRKFNYMGNTQFLSGEVVGKREEQGRHLVDLQMRMVNQRDLETAQATATVSLPSRSRGLSPLPPTPVEIQRQAIRMFARHNELTVRARRES